MAFWLSRLPEFPFTENATIYETSYMVLYRIE
jgi:hypothetical protein